jgi:hypothetical protein
MRRVVFTLGIVTILVSSCGRSDVPTGFAETLQDRVASIRELAEAGKPGLARTRLENLVSLVTSQLDRGLIDQGWALEILVSAEAVDVQLRLLRVSSETDTPSPSPTQDERDGGNGKGKDKGHGDEGNGKDD